MINPTLVKPCMRYLQSYLNACWEFKDKKVRWYNLDDPSRFYEWKDTIFEEYERRSLGVGLPEGYVPSSTFWLVENDEFIGTGNLRHWLTPPLEKYGGHIGYAIRPSKWGHRYGTLILRLLLEEARSLQIKRVLLTCDEENTMSAKVMINNGGTYCNTVEVEINGIVRRMARYWIELI